MAKGGRKRGPAEKGEAAAAKRAVVAPEPAKGPDKKTAKQAARAEKGLRKHLKRLERQLAAATKAEARRVRKLEKARWRRQAVAASLDDIRTLTAALPGLATASTLTKPAESHPAPKTAPRAKKPATEPTTTPARTAAPAGAAAMPIQAYCLREKKHVQMSDPKPVSTAKGGSAMSGTCPSCGAALYKLVGRAKP